MKQKNALFLFAAVIGHCLHYIDANKAVTVFTFASAFCKILVQTILQDSVLQYSHIKPPRKCTECIHHMQTLCVDSALRLELTKVHVVKEEQILHAIL